MDLSKLPKLSNTDPPPVVEDQPSSPRPVQTIDPSPSQATPGDVWISIAVGAIILFLYPRFLSWLSSVLFHTHFNQFAMDDGTIIPYPHVPEFWGDLGPTLFGLVLIVEGVALIFARKRAVMIGAFVLTSLATGYNVVYLVVSYSTYGLALVSAFAVAFGIYIAMYQLKLLKGLNRG